MHVNEFLLTNIYILPVEACGCIVCVYIVFFVCLNAVFVLVANIPTELDYLAGGGLSNQALLSMFDPSGGHLALDPSSIVGFANGQTIQLPSSLRNRFMTGLLNTLSVNSNQVSNAEPKTQFTFRNEDFTALGNIGHLVRVPNSKSTSSVFPTQPTSNDGSTSTSTHFGTLTGTKVTINGNPIEIIGVADMSKLDQSGNPHFFSFNPGSGSAAEIQALQSALLGTAVDMSNFIPPPYISDTGSSSASSSTQPGSSSVVTTNTITTLETVDKSSSSNNTAASSELASSAASSTIDKQLDMLLSQGHSQANSQSDIGAIVGQIDSAINDINKLSNSSSSTMFSETTGAAGGINIGMPNAASIVSSTKPEIAYNEIGTLQSGTNTMLSNLETKSGQSVDSENTVSMLSDRHIPSTLSQELKSEVDTNAKDSVMKLENSNIGLDVKSTHMPHLNDLKRSGMFPFEGNMAARYAPLLSDISKRIRKLNGRFGTDVSSRDRIQTKLSSISNPKISVSDRNTKTGGITFTSMPGTTASEGGTGIFAVSSTLDENLLKQSALSTASVSDVLSPMSNTMVLNPDSLPLTVNSLSQNTETKHAGSFTQNGEKLVLGNINKAASNRVQADNTGISNTNIDTTDNSIISLDTRNVQNAGMGSNSNIINASSNKILATNRITNNHQSANLADAVSVAMPGSNGGPITNMVGVQTGDITGILSQSSSLENTVPSGSFVVGAGQPNPTIIRTGRIDSTDTTSFSLSSRPDTMGTFSMGTKNSKTISPDIGASVMDMSVNTSDLLSEMGGMVGTGLDQSVGISAADVNIGDAGVNIVDTNINTVDLPAEFGGIAGTGLDNNTTVVHTVTTVEITEESVTKNTNHSSASVSADQSISSSVDKPLLNSLETKPFDPLTDTSDISGFAVGALGEVTKLSKMSMPNPDFQTKKDSVSTVQTEILTDQKPVELPRTLPLVMEPIISNQQVNTPETAVLSTISKGTGIPASKQTATTSSERFSIGSGLSVTPNRDAPGLPAKVSDQTKVVDLTKSESTLTKTEVRTKPLPSQWSATGSSFSRDGLAVGKHNKPIVGSIFGSSGESSSQKLTQKFLEQSGITKKPAVDFMTTFLNQESKSSLNGDRNLQIVPLGSDSTMRRSTTNMFVVGTGARKSEPVVDRFGVADITTRRQQLNRNQWSNFMSSRSQENGPQAKYLTQNVIGAAETRPLNGNTQGSITTDFSNQEPTITVAAKGSSTKTQTTSTASKPKKKTSGPTVFEAPGMSGRSAVSVLAFNNRMASSPRSALVTEKQIMKTSVVTENSAPLANTLAMSDTQRSPSVAGGQATAIKATEFANNFKRTLKSSGIPVPGPTFKEMPQNEKVDVLTTLSSTNSQTSDRAVLGMSGQSLGESMMVSESGPTPGIQGPISMTNIERMRFGEPVILNKALSTDISAAADTMLTPETSGLLINQNLDMAAARRGSITTLSNTPVMDNTAQTAQQVQATKFTSGNRFAVFGPANDVSGKTFRSKASSRQATGMRVGVLAPVAECRYRPDPSSRYYFIYKNGVTQHRFRCALGTAFDDITCECSIRISDHGKCNNLLLIISF